ncbi:hypothetical protein EI427_17205 [Flammeovirga pectinis]|uniref:Uncharacterized protein n=1 Tax=Flammeovirga pectinis TaxID=2494373 RepID=A0A3Q9FQX0_9BACT|nr:hypothetical protein [Flammeovirga pectinis]AZQ63898.1 hypothetical protein EI427_17205 [Flammeovirga pectinis]
MTRKNILKIHILATIIAVLTISSFFSVSLWAEINDDLEVIKIVKEGVVKCLPLLIIAMPSLAITGKKLAGNSKNKIVLKKVKRMNYVTINGVILISLAIFLYYRSHYLTIDSVFLYAQGAEFIFGLCNLRLIVLNAKSGLKLSRKI